MTKTSAILCTLLCSGLLAAGPAAASPAGPIQPLQCGFLNVVTTSFGAATVPMPNGVACNHGYFIGSTPVVGNPLTTQLEQSASYGPDCTITYLSGGNTYVIHVQQDYCGMEAGTIKANVVSGDATITSTTEGSYGQALQGQVAVTLNQPSPSPSAAARPAPQAAKNCGLLNVVVTGPTAITVPMPNGVTCAQGAFVSSIPAVGTTLTTQLQQSGFSGPTCTITYTSAGQTFQIYVHQNYCALEAGDITARVVTGNASITSIQEGSFGSNRAGAVYVNLNPGSSAN